VGVQRKSKFGFSPPPKAASTHTVRLVPLSQGVKQDTAWPLLAPGSTTTMTNYLPLDGCLVPRSRLSSVNTIRVLSGASSMAALVPTTNVNPSIWYSAQSRHAMVSSTGSVSIASFTSAFGLGVTGIASSDYWQYAQVYSANLDQNMLVAAGDSGSTLHVLYGDAPPQYSYLTSAPKAKAVCTFNNYVVAFNVGATFTTRVQWCVRGNPSNWTGEGSGFEDLLEMKGVGKAVRSTTDGRFYLFSTREIWYGYGADYPAQFLFAPLDQGVGCEAPATIQDTDVGILFLGSDLALRLLPKGGGQSQAVSHPVNKLIRTTVKEGRPNNSWGVYDWLTKCYHLFLDAGSGAPRPLVLNVVTGEWAFEDYNATGPSAGLSFLVQGSFLNPSESLFWVNSSGTVFSSSSRVALENGSVVTSTYRSAPIAADLAGNHKLLTQLDCDYRATSRATVNVKVSQDGGNSYPVTALPLSLLSAPVAGRATSQMYAGSAYPCVELTSTDTGYELHRLDATLELGGRR
jgi:hypothetical protein